MPDNPIDAVRKEIDEIDSRLVGLVVRRAHLAREIGKLKSDTNQPFFTPEREHEIFERLRRLDTGPLSHEQVKAVFREVISAARAAERPITVAFWGPEGTYSHEATLQTFGRSTFAQAEGSIEDVFVAVDRGRADYGVVPIENSIAGVVPQTLDMFPQTNVKICGETILDIRHRLATSGAPISAVTKVFAGPQPAAQCRQWLRQHLPDAEVIDVSPTARAGMEAQRDPRAAAIVNAHTAETLGLVTVATNIEDHANNRTRFVVLGANEPAPTGSDKTSLMFNLKNKPGQLYRILGAFDRHSVNLLMIESRPAQRETFEYLFYADCAGHRTDAALGPALDEIKAMAMEMTVLGSYPSTDPALS